MELDEYLEHAEGLLGISPTAKITSVQLTPRWDILNPFVVGRAFAVFRYLNDTSWVNRSEADEDFIQVSNFETRLLGGFTLI